MKWLAPVLLFLLAFPFSTRSFAQCGAIDFAAPSQVCLGQNILVQPDAAAESIEWDFSSGDFNSAPTAFPAFQVPRAVGRPAIELVQQNNKWFGFVTGTWTNTLEILEFANGIEESPTQITSLGDLDGKLNNPGSIRVVEEQGVWYGIIHNTGSAEILKVTFSDQFSDVSNVTVLTSGVGYINSGLAIGRDPVSGWTGIISEPDNTFTIIRFGNDLHPSEPEDIIETPAVPNPNNLGDIDLINVCGAWFGAAVNLGAGNTYLLRFGSDLFSVPQIDQIANLAVLNAARIRFANEGSEFFLFVASLDGLWHELRFGESINTTPVVENQGDLNGTLGAETYALAFAKENSRWSVFCVAQNNGQVYRLTYQQPDSVTPLSSRESSPVFKFMSAGTHVISMKAIAGGQMTRRSKSIIVLPEAAPDINFVSQNVCAGHDVLFTTSNLAGDIESYQWDFGDLSTSTDVSPSHVYDANGSYSIALEVTSTNGCTNYAFGNISIFNQPVPDFTTETGLLCTNNEVQFLTTTPDIYNGNLSYQWFVDNSPVSADRDLQYTFTTTGPKDVKLITSIPGCSAEITKTTSPIAAGPVVDFSFTGSCEDDTFSFQNETTDPVTGYQWDFGNGEAATIANPNHVFATYGNYSVSLTATNSAGCQNVKRETIVVHSRPQTDFSAAGPPNACSGIATQFKDESSSPDGAEITAWLWDFHDAGNPTPDDAKDATHTFATSGVYNVSLTATTAAGCAATTGEEISISPSPSTAFTFSPPCVGLPVSFASPQDNSIISRYWEIGNAYYDSSTPTHTFASYGDYPLYLEVTSENGCVSKVNKVIHVPTPLSPDFSALKNCVGQEAVLADVTSGADPVVSRQWTFDTGETFSGPQVLYTFREQGGRTITLNVTAESGCVYEASKEIEIVPAPTARFSADPATGAYPLEVRFVNTSSASTEYLWKFNDGSGATSTETSPLHTFDEIGSFAVELTAFNEQACSASFTAPVITEEPLPDADIEQINFTPNEDGSLKLIVTLHNKGNTVLRNLPLELDFNGELTLRQVLEEPIQPSSNFNYVFSTGIVDAYAVGYLCVSALVEKDVAPAGNRACQELDDRFVVLDAFPNPTTGLLHLEWIGMGDQTVRVSLTDVLGRKLLALNVPGSDGLNRRTIDLSGLQNGIYNVLIEGQGVKKIQRITVSGKP